METHRDGGRRQSPRRRWGTRTSSPGVRRSGVAGVGSSHRARASSPCGLTSGSLLEELLSGQHLLSPTLYEAPSSSPALPLRLLSVPSCCVHLFPISGGSSFCFLSSVPLKGPLFLSRPLLVCLCVPLVPCLWSPKGNSPGGLRTQRHPPSNTCHPSPSSPPHSPLYEGPSP